MADTVRDFFDALNRREIDRALDYFEVDARVDPGPWSDRVLIGRPAIKSFLGAFLPSLPGLRLNLTGVFWSRSEAIATVEVHATMSQLNPDPVHIPQWKGGQKVVWSGAFQVAFAPDRRIAGLRIYGDATEVRKETHVAPTA